MKIEASHSRSIGKQFRIVLPVLAALLVPQFANAQDITVNVDHEAVKFTDQGPVFRGDRVMIPLRGTLQKLGVKVRWDAESQTVTATRGNDRVVLKIGDIMASRNDQPFELHVPALIIHGTTMVPLRFVSQSFGAKVDWHEETHTVDIRTETDN